VFAQVSLGSPAIQKKIEISIELDGSIHVIHLIQKSSSPRMVDIIDGTNSNLQVNDIKGNEVEHAKSGIGKIDSISIFSSKEDVLVEYDLTDVLFLNNGVWVWNYQYPGTSNFIFPKEINLIFVNENPVFLENTNTISCHGCNLTLEYVLDEPKIHDINWEENSFLISSRTLSEITLFNFDQSSKKISFNVNEENQFITLIIPLELLWNPYEVFSKDEKILKHEFLLNETHALLNFKPENSGTIDIIGTSVIPEFPFLMPLIIGILMIVILQFKNKIIIR